MNQTEFTAWINRATMLFDDVRRFLASREGQQRELLEEWYALLADKSVVDANKVLDLLLSGEIQRPEYFDVGRLAGLVARESRALAAQRTSRRHYGSDQTYRCATCRDTGLVNVWNPRFVEAYREQFAEIVREEVDRDDPKMAMRLDRFDPDRSIIAYRYKPATWLIDAIRWWRGLRDDNGPIHHLARCNNSCDRARTLLAEREKFSRSERRFGTKELGMPACGMADYDPRVMPLKTPESYQDLLDWYAEHAPNEVYEWTPNAADYAQFR